MTQIWRGCLVHPVPQSRDSRPVGPRPDILGHPMELLTEGTLQSSKVDPYEKASHWLQMVQRQQVIVFKSDLLNNKSALEYTVLCAMPRHIVMTSWYWTFSVLLALCEPYRWIPSDHLIIAEVWLIHIITIHLCKNQSLSNFELSQYVSTNFLTLNLCQ